MALQIERTVPRGGEQEESHHTDRGYELVDIRVSGQKNKLGNSTFVRSIDEAAYLVEQGYAIRMTGRESSRSLVSPKSINIVRD